MSNKTLSERLKKLRDERGWRQGVVAEKIGVKANTLSGYENGTRTPDADMIKQLSILYNVTTDYLLGRSDDPELSKDQNQDFLEIKEIIEKLEREGRHKELESLKAYTKFLADALEKDN